MVADLLELDQRAEHEAATADALGLVDTLEHVVDHLLVQRCLFRRQRDLLARLDERRQVADDVRVGLQAAEDERPHQLPQALGLALVAVAFHRQREALAEVALRAQVARAAEFHDRPEFAQAVLHRRTGERDAELGAQRADRRGLLGGRVLDVLRLVEHHPAPFHLVEEVLVAGDQRIGAHHHVGARGDVHEAVALRAFQSVVEVHRELRRKARELAVPVAEHAHRRHQERRPDAFRLGGALGDVLSLRLQQGDQLDGLAEAHVVGQARAHAEALEEREPAHACALVGAQGALESLGLLEHGDLLHGAVRPEDLRDPALGVEAHHRQRAVGRIAVGKAQGLHQRDLTARVLLQELDAALQVLGADLHPLSVDAHQRHALLGQCLECLERERHVAERDLPAVVHQAVQADAAAGAAAVATLAGRGVALDEEPRADAVGGLSPPIRHQDLEARFREHRLEVAEELVRLGGLELEPRGRAFIERFLDLRVEAAGATELLEEHVAELLRFLRRAAAAGATAGSAVPQCLRVHHDRRAVVGDQAEREAPRVVVLVPVRARQEFRRRLQELEQEAHLATLADVLEVGDPLARGAHDARFDGRGLLHRALRAQQSSQPRHVRIAVRVAPVDRFHVALGFQHVADAAVDERAHRLLEERRCRAGTFGSAHHRGHAAGQCGEPCVVGRIVQPRAPRGEHGAAALLHHRGNHALVVDEVLRELRDGVPPARVMAPGHFAARCLGFQGAQQGERGARVQADGWHLHGHERLFGFGHEARGLVACRQAIARKRQLAIRRLDVRKQQRDAGVGDRALGADALVAGGACARVLDGRRNGRANLRRGGRERMRARCDGRLLCGREAVGVLAPDAQRSVRPIQVEYEHRGPMRRTVVRTRGVGAAVQ